MRDPTKPRWELDAHIARHPGALEELIVKALKPYGDPKLYEKVFGEMAGWLCCAKHGLNQPFNRFPGRRTLQCIPHWLFPPPSVSHTSR